MRGTVGKLFVALLLSACVSVHLLELSGHWDQTLSDANDEAGVIAVVLCIGMAVSVAGTVLKRLLARTLCRVIIAPSLGWVQLSSCRLALPVSIAGPPFVPLRI